jgi:hypothetical protein
VTPADVFAIALVLLFSLVVGGGVVLVLFASRWRRQLQDAAYDEHIAWDTGSFSSRDPIATHCGPQPRCWLAIKSRDPLAVQAALALTESQACSWFDGLTAERHLFIAPPLNDWILVIGDGLPCPSDDVDVCFHFLLALSRKLGHVQFFQTDRVLHHHAWARVETGRVVRAYAWAGETLWNQGAKTTTESALGMKCFAYDESVLPGAWNVNDVIATNVDRLPLLAAHWSLNPSAIDLRVWEQCRGIAGRLSRHY